jgi:hypothetical protein
VIVNHGHQSLRSFLKGDRVVKQRKEQLPIALELPVAKFQVGEWGDTAVAYVQLSAGADASPLLAGLPNDKCPCPHWGYVLDGAVYVSYADGKEEVCRAGELFYWPSGHTVRVDEDTSFVEFSPKRELKDVYDHIGRKVSAGG